MTPLLWQVQSLFDLETLQFKMVECTGNKSNTVYSLQYAPSIVLSILILLASMALWRPEISNVQLENVDVLKLLHCMNKCLFRLLHAPKVWCRQQRLLITGYTLNSIIYLYCMHKPTHQCMYSTVSLNGPISGSSMIRIEARSNIGTLMVKVPCRSSWSPLDSRILAVTKGDRDDRHRRPWGVYPLFLGEEWIVSDSRFEVSAGHT